MDEDSLTRMLSFSWFISFTVSIVLGYYLAKIGSKHVHKFYIIFYISGVILIDIISIRMKINPRVFEGMSIGLLMGLYAVIRKG